MSTTRQALGELQIACRALLAASQQLMESLPMESNAPTIETIVTAVADCYGFTFAKVVGRERTARVAEARHVSYYVCRALGDFDVVEMGKVLARDHSNISYGCGQVEKRLSYDKAFAERVEQARVRAVTATTTTQQHA